MQLGTSQVQELYSLSQLPTHVHTQLSWKVKWWLCPCLSHPHDWGLCSVLLHFCMHLSFDFDNQKLWIHKGFKLFIKCLLHSMSRQNFHHNLKCVQFNLSQINIFCHQLTQTMTTDFFRFTKIYTNCFEIQNLQNLCFEFENNCVNLRKSVKIGHHNFR